MIHHELFGQHLRLGNFLFQIAATVKLCGVHNCQTIYPDYYLWKYLKNPPQVYEDDHVWIDDIIRPRRWEWTPEEEEYLNSFGRDFRNRNMQLALNFFFQSEKWFEGHEERVYRALEPKNDVISGYLDKYPEITRGDKPRIGIGIRLGDFVGHGDFFQIPFTWYTDALNAQFPNWQQDYRVVVFSDDIERAKEIFKDFPFLYPEANNTHTHAEKFKHYHSEKAADQYFLGYWMDDWIIGNSTFSWWQAWLSTFKKGKVVHSGEVFSSKGSMKHCDTTHYYPERWTKHSA